MSQRRMFSKTIISSAAFIKMPPSTQALYFHLALNADDDGIVEAFSIIRMIAAADDDLKILVAKKFVTVLNEDLVTYINDWQEHNTIRADRKIDSKYKNLLLRIVEDVESFESKPRGDTIKGQKERELKKLELSGQSSDSPVTVQRQSSDSPVTVQRQSSDSPVTAQVSVSKCNLGEINVGKDRLETLSSPNGDMRAPFQKIIDLFHLKLKNSLPPIRSLTDKRKEIIRTRWRSDIKTLEEWEAFFDKVAKSDFLCGRKTDFVASFDWIIKASNCIKILEGNYDNRSKPNDRQPTTRFEKQQRASELIHQMHEQAVAEDFEAAYKSETEQV